MNSLNREPIQLESASGWFAPPVKRLPSPNFDARPDGCDVEVVIVHSISLPPRSYGGSWISDLFSNQLDPEAHSCFQEVSQLRVSAHCLVDRAGQVFQFVPVLARAWHAGESECLGRTRVNDFSVGIELEGCDDESFTIAQYDCLVALIRGLRRVWPVIGPERILGHCDIAPNRKTDPGPCFNWRRLRGLL
jgi:N-acetyl-anhydromuramoyl-L-alanine amidase